MSLQVYNPGQQHLVVTQDNTLNIEQGSVAASIGFGLFDTVTQGMGYSEVDKTRLEKNVDQVSQLNAKLAEALSKLTPQNLDEVVNLAKHVNQIGGAAHIGCSVCCVNLVRSDALHNYNDDLDLMNGISSRYLAIFAALKNADATPDEICQIVNLIVKRDDTIASIDVVEKDVFERELRQIASHNQILKDCVANFIPVDLEYGLHKAANKRRTIPKEIFPQFLKVSKSLDELMPFAKIVDSFPQIRMARNGEYKDYTDDQLLTLIEEEDQRICASEDGHRQLNIPGIKFHQSKPVKEFKALQKELLENPALLAKYDRMMTEARNFSGIVLKKLLLLDSKRRIGCLIDQNYYLFRLFFKFPQIYRCCVLICGEEKAFQSGTIQSRWKKTYDEFRESMSIILNDPGFKNLRDGDQRFANYLAEHRIGELFFDTTPT